jgi:uncharacterized protein YndB with AHSA1/START domain
MPEDGTIEPISLSIFVHCPMERAFQVFTEETSSWWPVRSHSIGEDTVVSVVMEGHVGGRIYEVLRDGTQADWGRFRVWDPPHRIEYDWNPNPDRTTWTHVITTFEAEGDGTRVSLEHRGWELLGDEARRVRASYATEGGWPLVLSRFTDAANAGAGRLRSDPVNGGR